MHCYIYIYIYNIRVWTVRYFFFVDFNDLKFKEVEGTYWFGRVRSSGPVGGHMLCLYITGYLPFIPLSVQVSSQLNSRGHVGYFFCTWVEIYNGNIQQMSIHKQVRLSVCVHLFHLDGQESLEIGSSILKMYIYEGCPWIF